MLHKDFFSIEKRLLKITGISLTNDVSVPYKIYSILTLSAFCFYTALLFVDLLTHKFVDVLESWFTFIGFFLGTSVTLTAFFNRARINQLLLKLQSDVFIADLSVLHEWYRVKNFKLMIFIIGSFTSVFVQVLYSITLRVIKGERRLSYGDITVINVSYSPNYECIFIYQTLSVLSISTSAMSIIIVISDVFEYIAAQFRILQDKVRLLGQNKLSPQDVRVVGVFVEALVISMQSLIVCNAGEKVVYEGGRVADAVYEVDFVGTDLRFQNR
ncbi:hypothetical protein RN001_011153 [Aquatica leii]|uniref:Uncharacterized protein n=1 Tax=Aquatica leii TaxID=1421715 RepID=A0AAN7PXH7_9COLE|nr:hypothetical protein RN001_011153 [Aquatica leii]